MRKCRPAALKTQQSQHATRRFHMGLTACLLYTESPSRWLYFNRLTEPSTAVPTTLKNCFVFFLSPVRNNFAMRCDRLSDDYRLLLRTRYRSKVTQRLGPQLRLQPRCPACVGEALLWLPRTTGPKRRGTLGRFITGPSQ